MSFGFRPFFLLAGVWPVIALPVWVLAYLGVQPFARAITRDWHVHEMLFGYLAAVMVGFLLTAVPNWTGRGPVSGARLAGLAGLWIGGRAAMLVAPQSAWAAAADAAFLVVFAVLIWREVLAARNWRNLVVCLLVSLLALANIGVHQRGDHPQLALGCERLALGVAATMIALIGGRVTPAFTRNWLMARRAAALPVSPSKFDLVVLIGTALATGAWIVAPDQPLTGAALALAGVANLVRLARWRVEATFAEPLVWILHAGYAWLGVAFLLLGGSALTPSIVPRSAGIHALTAGAVGVMTMAMMTRAILGHTGRSREAGRGGLVIYLLLNAGAALRIAAAFRPVDQTLLLGLSSIVWCAGFVAFTSIYGPMLVRRRVGG